MPEAIYRTGHLKSPISDLRVPDVVRLELDGSALARWEDGRPAEKFASLWDLQAKFAINVIGQGRCVYPARGGRNHLSLDTSPAPPPGYVEPGEEERWDS